MFIKRTATWLFAWLALAMLGNTALAQVPANSNLDYQTPGPTWENGSAPFAESAPRSRGSFFPFHPLGFEPSWDWFGPAETSSYGAGPRAKIGWFGSYERVYWSLSAPQRAFVGSETASPTENFFFPDGPTADNSFIGAIGAWGNRWELGYVDNDNYGWLVSVLDHVSQGQFRSVDNPALLLGDPNGLLHGFVPLTFPEIGTIVVDVGPLPTAFSVLALKNALKLNGLELMRFYRASRLHDGAYFELLYGARWFQINDTFIAQAVGNGNIPEVGTIHILDASTTFQFPTNILDGSEWSTRAMNNLIGPQIGVRFFQQHGHWTTSLEARFLAAANFVNMTQKTNLGDQTINNQGSINQNMTTNFRGLGSDTHLYQTTFSPMGELRVNVAYQATSNVALKIGYTGMVVGNISRASNRIDYDSVNLIGISKGNFHQTFFVNGINFGVEINR